MKFCYIDESGNGSEPFLVIAGVIADASRMHMTKREWSDILQVLSRIIGKPIPEFKTRHFYRGNGIWHDLSLHQRKTLMDVIIDWLKDRRHKLAFTALDKVKADGYNWSGQDEYRSGNRPDYWRLAALHFTLCIQKEHQGMPGTKGHTVLVFDREVKEEAKLIETVLNPPVWTDAYYDYDRDTNKADDPGPLSHIVDVPYFADSKHVGMLHIADLFAYLLRHYAELTSKHSTPAYPDEETTVRDWIKRMAQFMLPDSNRWTARGACDCAKMFRELAPEPLVKLHSTHKQ